MSSLVQDKTAPKSAELVPHWCISRRFHAIHFVTSRGRTTFRDGSRLAIAALQRLTCCIAAFCAHRPYRRNAGPDGTIRDHYRPFPMAGPDAPDRIAQKREEAERAFQRVGIHVRGLRRGHRHERLIPSTRARIIPATSGRCLERGLKQRVAALNAFLGDIYHDQRSWRRAGFRASAVLGNAQYRRRCTA